jgi:solute carrier family 27 fatty acid transporter 1/4
LGEQKPIENEISTGKFVDLSIKLETINGDEPKTKDVIDFKSVLCFIYTSGTTGLPKAAVMKHFRFASFY